MPIKTFDANPFLFSDIDGYIDAAITFEIRKHGLTS